MNSTVTAQEMFSVKNNFSTMHATSMRDTNTIWQHHIEAWNAKDLHAILSDYAENAILILNNQIYLGKEEIGAVFTRLFNIFGTGVNKIDDATIKDRIVYITWNYKPRIDKDPIFFGTDTFVIENGTISYQTIGSTLYNKENYPVAPAPTKHHHM